MNRVRRVALLISCICVIASTCSWAAIPVKPQGWVSDFAGILSDTAKSQVTALFSEVKKSTGAEIAVVTVSSLDGMSVEEYAVSLFKKWEIGEKGKDNGVLFLIAPNERKVRIEVGYGLEPVITNDQAGSIIRESILPFFKAGDYDQGTLQGSMQIASLITGKKFGPSSPILGSKPRSTSEPRTVKVVVMLLFVLFVIFGFLGRRRIATLAWSVYRFLQGETKKYEAGRDSGARTRSAKQDKSRSQDEDGRHEEKSQRSEQRQRQRYSKNEQYYKTVLGLPENFIWEDVKRQHRALAAQYHPDKVNHLGDKLKELAQSEMKEINEAYDFFRKRYET
jgi:uncharacterized protein